jgi:hypothetical protein
MRHFDTGATRDSDEGKIDPEGCFSVSALIRFAEYMRDNQVQADGNIRGSDNWQAGIPLDSYMKSMMRHMFEVWRLHRTDEDGNMEEALCGVMFNVQGYLHEITKSAGGDPAPKYPNAWVDPGHDVGRLNIETHQRAPDTRWDAGNEK